MFTVIIAVIAFVSVPAFADFQKQVEDASYTTYGNNPMVIYSGDDAKTSDNVVIADSTAKVTYDLKNYNILNSDTLYLKKQGGLDIRIKWVVEDAINSTFAKYDIEYIKTNTKAVFQEVIDTAQGNADYINPGLSIQLGRLDVKNIN